MRTTDSRPCEPIKEWEDAGASLLAAFRQYTQMCTSLGAKSLGKGAKPKDLASRIENILENIHAVISDQLPKVTSGLVQTRNALISPTSQLPEEVLSNIFINMIFDRRNPDGYEPLSVEQSVRLIHGRLGALCSVWRDILIARSSLWSVIPMISDPPSKQLGPYLLGLQRAGTCQLHLAAVIESDMRQYLYDILKEYGSQFRVINLSIDDYPLTMVMGVIARVLRYNTSGALSEFSIMLNRHQKTQPVRFDEDYNPYNNDDYEESEPRTLRDDGHIFPRKSLQQAALEDLVKSLTAFRIRRVDIYWDNISFSSRFVELLVDSVTLGYDDATGPFLKAISSASELCDLKLISIKTFCRNGTIPKVNFPAITLPKLQSLFLQDLYFNTLKTLLSMIAPGSHQVTLFLERNSLEIYQPTMTEQIIFGGKAGGWVTGGGNNARIDVMEQWMALGPIQVNMLLFSGRWGVTWLTEAKFHTILRAMPALRILNMDKWVFDNSEGNRGWTMSNLGRSEAHAGDYSFPALEALHLTRTTIHAREAFKEMVNSHPLQQIVIGGRVEVVHPDEAPGTLEPLQEDDEVMQWLRNNVPCVRLVDDKYCVPELYSDYWRLW